MNGIVEFNNIPSSDFGIYQSELVTLPAGQPDIEEIEVPMRDGIVCRDKKRRKKIELPISFNYSGPADKWFDTWRKAKKWLKATNTTMRMMDDPNYFYKVYYVILGENVHALSRIGKFTATFVCEQHQYVYGSNEETKGTWQQTTILNADGFQLLTADDAPIISSYSVMKIMNEYEASHPIYRIIGDGTTVMMINGYAVECRVPGEIHIDTERQVSYLGDKKLANTYITGDYERMYLQEGENEIMISDGFEVRVIPMWRCL